MSESRLMAAFRACSGLDMTDVPEGAVKRLVEAVRSFDNTGSFCDNPGADESERYDTMMEALAPFLAAMKESK